MADAVPANGLKFLAGGGLAGSQLRALDWTASPLGPPGGWPQSLRTAVKLMLNMRHPVSIFWGPDALHLFNDAAGQSFGAERRGAAVAQPAAIVWNEIWEMIGPQVDQVMTEGASTWHDDQIIPIHQDGQTEEVYWTYSCYPIDDPQASNEVGGVLVISMEATQSVLAGRQKAAEDERKRGLFEQAPGFVIITRGPEHIVEFVNREHRSLFDSDTWPGKTIRAAVPDTGDQSFFELLDKIYVTGGNGEGARGPSTLSSTRYGRREDPVSRFCLRANLRQRGPHKRRVLPGLRRYRSRGSCCRSAIYRRATSIGYRSRGHRLVGRRRGQRSIVLAATCQGDVWYFGRCACQHGRFLYRAASGRSRSCHSRLCRCSRPGTPCIV